MFFLFDSKIEIDGSKEKKKRRKIGQQMALLKNQNQIYYKNRALSERLFFCSISQVWLSEDAKRMRINTIFHTAIEQFGPLL